MIGSIISKKDGTEESGSIMLQEDQTSVRYQLNLKTGNIILRQQVIIIGVRMRALRKKPKTEHKMWRLSIHELNFVKAGTYYLELSDYSSESQKIIKWKAGKVKDITPENLI